MKLTKDNLWYVCGVWIWCNLVSLFLFGDIGLLISNGLWFFGLGILLHHQSSQDGSSEDTQPSPDKRIDEQSEHPTV